MLKIMYFLLDILFPPRPTEIDVRKLHGLDTQLTRTTTVNGIICLSDYANQTVRSLILENKYHENEIAQKYLAAMLREWLSSQEKDILVIPIPLGAERRKQRGYNQVETIIAQLPKAATYSCSSVLLERVKETVPQTSLNRIARLKNMDGVFACNTKELARMYTNQTIVIVDDVTTTGATLRAARAELMKNLPPSGNIICLAIAH